MYDFGQAHIEFGGTKPTELTSPGLSKVHLYLKTRGIDPSDIDKLGLLIAPARELISKARGSTVYGDDPRLALIFPHIDSNGRQIEWWSARLIDTDIRPTIVTSFSSLVEQKKWGKMFCPPAEPPHAYLVPTLNWSNLKYGDTVYIHESCIKAINGANLGYWSVGLNGVRGWSARKHGLALVDELRALPWKALRLNPVIVFDSNAADNWDVQHAIGALAAKLFEITGQRARHLDLPRNPDGDHWGFDDFCVRLGADAARGYLDASRESPEVNLSEIELKKLALNEEVVVIRSLGRIAEQATGTLMSRATFIDINYATWTAFNEEDKPVSIPRAWLIDDRRIEVERLEYAPGKEPLVPGEFLNLWKGMGIEPKDGDCMLWLELVARQIPDEKHRKWFLQWLAYPLQNLGAKMNSYVHLFGPPGTGKNGVLAPLMAIYGANGLVIGKDQIASAFNSVYATRQFVNLDEIHGGTDMSATAVSNRIKMIVTSPRIVVNAKGQPEYEIENHVNLVTTSNYSDSIKFDEEDRRAFVLKFEQRMGQDWWIRYFADLRAEQVYSYLLRVDLADFDPAAPAPDTPWKEQVIDATRDAMTKWVRDLWSDPDSCLPDIMRGARFLTPEQLGAAYYPGEPGRNTPGLRNMLGQRMADIGFKRTGLVKVDGSPKRYWIIRNHDAAWATDEIRAERKNSKF